MKKIHSIILGVSLSAASSLLAQTNFYSPTNATGQLVLTRTTNLLQKAQAIQSLSVGNKGPEVKAHLPQFIHPSVVSGLSALSATPSGPSLTVSPTNSLGFNALSHYDQRMAGNGNQFSTEPATPAIAVGNGFILEGVDNAIQIFSTSGTPQLPHVVTANQLFGVSPQIDRNTDVNGVYTTDTRAFWDPDIQRFMVLQWSQANDSDGNLLPSSTEYLAVTQTADPTGIWNIYTMNTTDFPANFRCPCVPDYPQIGADQYGFYISTNEFNTGATFANANILAISKSQLGAGVVAPTMVKFLLPFNSGYEFAIQPATTPPGASYFMANGGLEYFVSSISRSSVGNNLAVWAMANTSALNTLTPLTTPALTLTQILVPTEQYTYPNSATQKEGARPYGTDTDPTDPNRFTISQKLAFIDGGPDSRVLSLSYSGGRLYLTMQVELVDQNGKNVVGAAYMILSPAYRGVTLTASVMRQGYLLLNGQHLLRPVVAVNGQGRGAVVFTLVGPNYYPSAAYVPINFTTTGTVIQLAGQSVLPEDGFTGYCPDNGAFGCGFGTGIARWGDNSAAVIAADGSMWGVTEYIPSAVRTQFANWGTYVMKITP